MRMSARLAASSILTLVFATSAAFAHEGEEHWVCIKKEKEIPTKGKTDKEKEADCKKQKGKWQKKDDAAHD